MAETLAGIYKSALDEVKGYDSQIAAAQTRLAEAAEEKRQAAIAAAAKKKNAVKKGNKKDEERNETPAPEEPKANGRKSVLEGESDSGAQNWDLFLPSQFAQALKHKFTRRFTFGPVEFSNLDQGMDSIQGRQLVTDALEQSPSFAEPGSSVCVHGYRVAVKERTLKRATTLLKHARFLQNLEVTPVWPAEPEPEVPADNEAQEDAEEAEV